MPNPRVPDDVKRRRGTYRADRAEGAAVEPESAALREYKALALNAYTAAVHGEDVSEQIAYLRQCEDALHANGIGTPDGKWKLSVIADLAQRN